MILIHVYLSRIFHEWDEEKCISLTFILGLTNFKRFSRKDDSHEEQIYYVGGIVDLTNIN